MPEPRAYRATAAGAAFPAKQCARTESINRRRRQTPPGGRRYRDPHRARTGTAYHLTARRGWPVRHEKTAASRKPHAASSRHAAPSSKAQHLIQFLHSLAPAQPTVSLHEHSRRRSTATRTEMCAGQHRWGAHEDEQSAPFGLHAPCLRRKVVWLSFPASLVSSKRQTLHTAA